MTQLLVVDDDEDFAGAARMVLQSRGYDVAMEHETDRVMPRLHQRLPDALVLDVMFPDNPLGGIELAKEVRATYPDLPIVMLTAVNQHMPFGFSNGVSAANLPVSDFLEKPIDFRVLCDKLDRLLRRPTHATEGM